MLIDLPAPQGQRPFMRTYPLSYIVNYYNVEFPAPKLVFCSPRTNIATGNRLPFRSKNKA